MSTLASTTQLAPREIGASQLLLAKASMAIVLALAMLLSLAAPVVADNVSPGREPLTVASQRHGPTDPTELEAFLDQLLGTQMKENQIAGAAVSVVRAGKLLFAKGYGYADLAKGIPVDPEHTIFRTGSVGKTFTSTAVMQLVEQGKLDLDADVNTYLDFRIPNTYPQPITLKHLLTHTSGLENRLLASAVRDSRDLVPAREWLVSHMHARVRPPGVAAAYSNYNTMLAGYIVERVSGQPYDRYIQQHIFDPLGMTHSAASSQLPPDLRPHVSVGYASLGGVLQPFPEYIAQPAAVPAGGHHSSVIDMARYMIAHLENGRFGDAHIPEVRILKEATMQQMHSGLYAPHPRLLRTAHGFFDFTDNGQRTLGHSGESPPMHTLLLLLPDQNLGVFVAYNSQGGSNLTNQHTGFQRAFFDHYYPAPAVEPVRPTADFAERASRFEGSYRWTMGSKTTLMKLVGFAGTAQISHLGDGTLRFASQFGEWRFAEVEPLYFRQVDGPFGLVFGADDRGRISHLSSDLMPQFAFEKLAWYETPGFQMPLVLGSVLVFLSNVPVALIRFIRDRRLRGDRTHAPRGARVAQWIVLAISVLNVLFLIGAVLGAMQTIQNPLLDPPLLMKVVLAMGVMAAALTTGAAAFMVLAWKHGYWGIATRSYHTLVTVAAISFVWFMSYWNMLGWRF